MNARALHAALLQPLTPDDGARRGAPFTRTEARTVSPSATSQTSDSTSWSSGSGTQPRVANTLIERHRFPQDTRLHRQRLTVPAVPVQRAEYRWGKGTRGFFVYGEGWVHAPSYPLSLPRIAALILCLAGLSGAIAALVVHLSG